MYSQMSYKKDISNTKIQKQIKKLNNYFLKQKEKVAYAYKNLKTNDIISFNIDTCFYSASTIKLLVCLYLYEQAIYDKNILKHKINVTEKDYKQGSGVIKYKLDKYAYSIKELIYYTLKYSDNTAYIKLMEYVTPKAIKEYGTSLKAEHTLEGKDLFGITNASDMICYLERLYQFISSDTEDANDIKNIMLDPEYQIIQSKNIDYLPFIRKYGSFNIAYHEVGIVLDESPYILIILTQKNKLNSKKRFFNIAAKKINKINKLIKNE